jgi:tripartite-type tricarboxylate transporter receptor subunit TctC
LQYTSGGIGSYGHLWWEMLRARLELPGQHVAYNGIAPALKDAIGGQVPLLIDAIVPTGAQVKAGTVRGLAIVSKSRARSLPDVPTLAEQGYPGLDAAPFYGILGPAHLDPAVVRKLNSTLITVLNSTAVKAQLQEQGFDVVAGSPEAYGKLIGDEIARWTAVVQRAGIKVE